MEPARLPDEVPSAPESGRLQGISVPDLMWALCRGRKTGVLRLRLSGITKTVYIEDGRIVFASSDDGNERLGETLVRDGLISLDQYEKAVARLDSGKRLGTLLVEAGHLTPENLVRSVLAQVRGIVLGLFAWGEGDYDFQEGPLPREEVIQLGMHTGELILQGIRQIRSFRSIRQGVGLPRTRYRLASGWRERLTGVSLTDGEAMLLQCLENGPQRVEKLCHELFLSNFEIYQALWAFRVLGIVERAQPSPGAEDSGGMAGRLDQEEFAAVLVRLCRQGETGVLHASRGFVDRTFHIKEGRCVFATSTNPDDGLVSHLFRRGVISLQDREEVSRRLLTNRRVGTILQEMGALDETDLLQMVREQLSEIVYDTVRSQEGEYVFSPGELPTIEDITLDCTIEDLVLRAVRKVTAWSRVLKGLGGLDTCLALTPDYLASLDRMSIGGDEWDIVASLRTPRTLREICQGNRLGDFRVCQTLWALKLLGAVAEAPAQPSEEVSVQESLADPNVPPPAVEIRWGESVPVEGAALEAPTEEAAPPEPATLLDPSVYATRFIASEEVVASLGSFPQGPGEARFELAEPGTGTEQFFREVGDPQAPTMWTSMGAALEEASRESVGLAEPAGASDLQEPGPADDAEEADETGRSQAAPAVSPLESALHEPREAAGAPPEEETEDPDLERQIQRFNARQQIVYRTIRSEIGAGVANFVRSCAGSLTDGFNNLFAPVGLQDDGTWEAVGLRSSLKREGVLDPWIGFQRLLDKELEVLALHLGEARARNLRERIEKLERDAE